MIAIVYLLTCMAFYAAFVRLDLVARSIALFGVFRSATMVMADANLDDREKETRIQKAALHSLKDTLGFVARLFTLLLLAAFPVVFTAAMAGLDVNQFVVFSLDPGILVCTMLAMLSVDRIRQARIRKAEAA